MRMEGKNYVSHQIDGTVVYGNVAGCGSLILVQADAVDTLNTITNLLINTIFFSFLFLFLKG